MIQFVVSLTGLSIGYPNYKQDYKPSYTWLLSPMSLQVVCARYSFFVVLALCCNIIGGFEWYSDGYLRIPKRGPY